MKLINAFYFFIILNSCAGLSTTPSDTTPINRHEQLLHALHQNGELLKFTIESTIDDMQQQIIHTTNNDATIEQLKILHRSIESSLNKQTLQVDEATLSELVDELFLALSNFRNGIGCAFDQWQAPAPITRTSTIKTFSEIEQKQQEISRELLEIHNKAQYVCLNVMRRWYRKCCNGLAQIHITTITTRKFLAAAALFSWFYFTYSMPKRDAFGTLRYPDGTPADFNRLNFFIKAIDWLERAWGIDLTPSKWNFPIPIILMEYSLKDEAIRTHVWLTQKLKNFHYYLKGRRPQKDEIKTYPTHGFENIRGNEHNKKEALKVIEYLVDHERFTQKNIPFQHGMLLLGKTRTGKTFFAEKFCGELNKHRIAQSLSPCPFIQVDAGKIYSLEGWEKGLRGYIDLAREEAPCILFIDELHHLVKDDRKTLTELLTGMSGAFHDSYERPIIIIAATNHPECIDRALRQKGRFGIELLFEYPLFHERREQLKQGLHETFLELNNDQLDALAYETDQCSYDDLNELVAYMKQEANINKKPISSKLLEEALDKIIRKIKTPETALEQETKHIIAIHHACHLISIKKLSPHKIVTKITLDPLEVKTEQTIGTQQGDVFSYSPCESSSNHNSARLIAECKELLAGHAGEIIFFGASTYAYQQEADKALAICKQLCSKGITLADLSSKIQTELTHQAIALKNKYEQEVLQLLTNEKELIVRIAHELEQHETLTQTEIAKFFDETKFKETEQVK